MARTDSGKTVLDKVKRSFLRMTSPFEFGGQEEHFDTMNTMNIPPMLARADAAYEKAVKILHYNVFSHTDEERKQLYRLVEYLLLSALSNITECREALSAEKKILNLDSFYLYLVYLKKLNSILCSLAAQQAELDSDEHDFTAIFGNAVATPFRSADNTFSDSEMNVFHFLTDVIQSCEVQITRIREQYKKVLSKTDLGRYAKAYSEYVAVYAKYEPDTFTDDQMI